MNIQDPINNKWRLTAFYGYSDSGRRRDSWDMLHSLAHLSDDPWCVIRDFNNHLSPDDKRGGPDRPPWLIRGFQNAVADCGLTDLPLIGYQYTWFKSIGTNSSKEARLDRALCTSSWINTFSRATLQTLVAPMSDHTPILLQLQPVPWRNPHRSFRFNNSWLLETDFAHNIKNGWNFYHSSNFITNLSYCIEDMKLWSKESHPHFQKGINNQRALIENESTLHDDPRDPRIIELQNNLATLLLQEDSYWKQRSNFFLLKDGDTNSKFFHASVTACRRKNTITKLHHPNGSWLMSHDDMSSHVHDYFSSIFREVQGDKQPVIDCVQPRVTEGEKNTRRGVELC